MTFNKFDNNPIESFLIEGNLLGNEWPFFDVKEDETEYFFIIISEIECIK